MVTTERLIFRDLIYIFFKPQALVHTVYLHCKLALHRRSTCVQASITNLRDTMLRNLIYFLKRLVHHNTYLYQLMYNMVTLNVDYLQQRLRASRYSSSFGGMWTDRCDFETLLSKKCQRGEVVTDRVALLREWREQGYVILPQAINDEIIDDYLVEIQQLKQVTPSPLLVTSASIEKPTPYSAAIEHNEESVRTVDDYFYVRASRRILLDEPVMDFIECIFEKPPMLTQSLSFQHGSQQAIHQDTVFVRMNSPMKLVAIWVALEDVESGVGELRYYPGSHNWEGFLFSGRFKHWDKERDGLEQLAQWHQWLEDEARARNCQAVSFLPRKGDVLVWHAGLAHGGAPVTRPGSTRQSLVGHYCPHGVRPLYHYYKPAQRKLYHWEGYRYCSSYYR